MDKPEIECPSCDGWGTPERSDRIGAPDCPECYGTGWREMTADEIADEAVEMTAFEDFVIERVGDGQSILGLYPPTDEANRAAFAAWRKAKGR